MIIKKIKLKSEHVYKLQKNVLRLKNNKVKGYFHVYNTYLNQAFCNFSHKFN